MTGNIKAQKSNFQDAHRHNSVSEPEHHILTHEAVDEQVKSYFASSTKQVQDFSLLRQGMTLPHPGILPPTADRSAGLATAGSLSNFHTAQKAFLLILPNFIIRFLSFKGKRATYQLMLYCRKNPRKSIKPISIISS